MTILDIKNAYKNQEVKYMDAKAVCGVQDPERRYRLFMTSIKVRDEFINKELERIKKLRNEPERKRELAQLLKEASYGNITKSVEKARLDLLNGIADKQITFRQVAKQYRCDFTIFSAKKGKDAAHGRMPPISALSRMCYDKAFIDKSVNEMLLGEKLPVTLPHKLDLAVANFERLANENNVLCVDVMRRQHIAPLYDIYNATRLKFVESNARRNDAIGKIINEFAIKNVKEKNENTEQAIRDMKNAASDPIHTKFLLDERINELREDGFREYNNSAPFNASMRSKICFQRSNEGDYSTRGIHNTTFMLLRIETGQPIDYFAVEDYTQQCDLQYTDCNGKKQLVKSEITKQLVGFWLGMHPDDQDQVILDWTQHAMRSLYLLK